MPASECNSSTIVAGAFNATIQFPGDSGPLALGGTEEGFEIERVFAVEDITTDESGDMVVGAIFRGGNCYVNSIFKEFNSHGVRRLLHPFSSDEGAIGNIGCDIYSLSGELILTERDEFINQPDRYTFPKVQLDPAFPLRYALSSALRTLPFRFRVFPYFETPGDYDSRRWYTKAAVPPPA